MATIRRSSEKLIFLSGDKFVAVSNGGVEEIQIPECNSDANDPEKQQSKADEKNARRNCILASAFSASGKYFAVGDDQKKLHVYKVLPRWELVSSRLLARRCTAVTFPQNEKEVVLADRTGDVYRYSLIDTDSDGDLLLGHLSMVLDVVITRDDRYIITCDRDEKIRISHYPNAYNILAYCLQHTEYVSQVLYLEDFNSLVSCSGDGTLASWTLNGKNLCTCVTNSQPKNNKNDTKIDTEDNLQGEDQMEVDNSTKSEGQTKVESENEDDVLGVKRMSYSEELGVIAVIYHRSKLLQLFIIEKIQDGCSLVENSHNTLAEEPWDICFDKNRLWVLMPCEQSPAVAYECVKDKDSNIQMSECVDGDVVQTRKTLCNRWSNLKDAVDWRNEFIGIQKVRTFENVQRYMEKKEERINAQKNKQPPPPKKMKAS